MIRTVSHLISQVLAPERDWRFALMSRWSDIVGDLDQRMRCEAIQGSRVTIGVYDHHWMQELYCMSPVIKERINAFLRAEFGFDGKDKVQSLLFRTVQRHAASSQPVNNRARMYVKRALTDQEKKALAVLPDAELKKLLEKFLMVCSS